MAVSLELCRAVPKIALHDHLDGGLRPATIVELAAEVGHVLPETDPEALGRWFFAAADSGSLVRYLETFAHTIAVMQTADQLRRVAREFVEDQAADGVIYAEARWAPEQHLAGGLSLTEAVAAVRDGLAEGVAAAAASGRTIMARQIVTSMRHASPTTEIAELAVAFRNDSVCGFDIAGAEDGFPPSRFVEAFDYLKRHNFEFTIHAGEAFGLPSIWEAVQLCGASRLGHGVRLIEDVAADGSLGELASYVRNRRIALELCPSSNLQTGICATIAEHPFGRLAELDFRVTVSCDNRLMSATTLSREYHLLSEAFGYSMDDLRRFSRNAAKSAFLPWDQRLGLIRRVEDEFSALAG
ncbi:adenosine deaminase [Propionicimonas paludicola]|uniref:Adenosine deaminase n=1 Tax=Propionicimonas paludicola TaxID=185243 RepID=A0A2A9CN39_9ACTN|nr:adenosine deaminase [Propionicimonas paludicola]PFG15867.1 adenosine deaminase [Propionicimonas paludicola]